MSRRNNTADICDSIIGQRVKELRVSMGLSRVKFAPQIGVSQQQLQKYEIGTNRISSGRMVALANATGKPVSYFFEGVAEENIPRQLHHSSMAMQVSRNFMRISNPVQQNAVNMLVRSLMDTE